MLTISNDGSVEEGVDLVRRCLLGDAEAVECARARTKADTAAPETKPPPSS